MNKLEHTFTTWTCSRDGGSRGVQGGAGGNQKTASLLLATPDFSDVPPSLSVGYV